MEDIKDTILIADDQEINRVILREVFNSAYILEAENGQEALEMIEQYHDSLSVVLLDIVMPEKNGYQVLKEMDQEGYLDSVPVIVITALNSADDAVKAFDMGASDVIVKPFEPYLVKRRVQNIVDLRRQKINQKELIEKQAEALRKSNDKMIDMLSSIIESRSLQPGQHIRRIRLLTQTLLEQVNRTFPEYGLNRHQINMIARAAALHDIGKIAIPKKILDTPGPLAPEEYEIVKTHVERGSELLASVGYENDEEFIRYAYDICRYHHLRWNQTGYPLHDSLSDDVPVWAEVVGIADCYDALTHDQVYRKAMLPEQALNMIFNGKCGTFSEPILECLKLVTDEFRYIVAHYGDQEGEQVSLKGRGPVRMGQNLSEQGWQNLKYNTLLQYMDSTVAEIDFVHHMYHVIYVASTAFEALRTGTSIVDALEKLMKNAVHPEDRAALLPGVRTYMEDFFQDNQVRRSRHYRILNSYTGQYDTYEETLIRLHTGMMRQQKALLIWHLQFSGEQEAPARDRLGEHPMLHCLLEGVKFCKADKDFTLPEGNEFDGFLGYTAEELRHVCDNQYVKLIYPGDRSRVVREYWEQRRHGNQAELMYRLVTKEGCLLWVLDKSYCTVGKNQEEYIYFVLIDITQTREHELEVQERMELYQLLMDHTNDIIMEWDMASNGLKYISHDRNERKTDPVIEANKGKIQYVFHIHPEELQEFVRLTADIRKGCEYGELELRLMDQKGCYRWYKMRIASRSSHWEEPTKAVCVLTCIDAEKRSVKALHDRADHDVLTGLYEKGFAVKTLKNYFMTRKEDDISALFILDVDDFKHVNDTYGHMFGDKVLKRAARELMKLFRNDDMIARIGGDEFLIFMRHIRERDIADMRAAKVNRAFRTIRMEEEENFRITCSMGVAVCPDDGCSFEELFRRSDLALYTAKDRGKNQYALYDPETMQESFEAMQALAAARTSIDSE